MSIKIKKINTELQFKIKRKFELMTTNTILVRIDCSIKDVAPYHWFLEKQKASNIMKPPFDIAISRNSGDLSYVKFFLQDREFIFEKPQIVLDKEEFGLPSFDISEYNDKNYQFFEEGEMTAYCYDNTITLLNSSLAHSHCINLDNNNALIFDANDCVAGLIIRTITEIECNILKEGNLI